MILEIIFGIGMLLIGVVGGAALVLSIMVNKTMSCQPPLPMWKAPQPQTPVAE